MAAVVIEIRDAVVDALEGASLSQSFDVISAWEVTYDIRQFTDGQIKVTVIPTLLQVQARDLAPREGLAWDVGIWVQKKCGRTAAEGDPIMTLAEEIALLFSTWRTAPVYRLIDISAQPAHDPKGLDTQGLFTANITLTVRVTRP